MNHHHPQGLADIGRPRTAAPSPEPDRAAAERFLQALDADPHTVWHFRTFGDSYQAGGRNYTGTLADVWLNLTMDNAEGRGVFVVVNAGGHRAADITSIRSVFVDLDGAPLEPALAAVRAAVPGLEPGVVVDSSPGRWHAYWPVEGVPPERFRDLQKALIRLTGADPAVHDLSRVMRLPGTVHRKREPVPVRLAVCRPVRYAAADLGPLAPAGTPTSKRTPGTSSTTSSTTTTSSTDRPEIVVRDVVTDRSDLSTRLQRHLPRVCVGWHSLSTDRVNCGRETAHRLPWIGGWSGRNAWALVLLSCRHTDVDRWRTAGIRHPHYVVVDPSSGHHTVALALSVPVKVQPEPTKAMRYYAAVRRGLAAALGADLADDGIRWRNPAHTRWQTVCGPEAPAGGWSLTELAEPLGRLPSMSELAQGVDGHPIGRNCHLFKVLSAWANDAVIGQTDADSWSEQCVLMACRLNAGFAAPMADSEAGRVGKSVARRSLKYHLEVARPRFLVKQAERGRARAAAVNPGRTALALTREQQVVQLRADGLTWNDCAGILGITAGAARQLYLRGARRG